jgi:hypothetical protein
MRQRMIVYECVRNRMSLPEVNRQLAQRGYPEISDMAYTLWRDYLVPVSERNPRIKEAVINDGADLSQIARQLKEEHRTRGGIS